MFKYFNPLWIIQNFLQTNLNPVLIGAGIGAVGSAVQGKSPLTGALLGGATGGLFGGSESLLGGKIADAFGGAVAGNAAKGVELAQVGTNVGGTALNTLTPVAGGGLGGGINIAPFVKEAGFGFGSNALPSAATTTGAFAEGIQLAPKDLGSLATADMSRLAVDTPLSMGEKVSKFGSDAYSWAKKNPIASGNFALQGLESMNTPTRIDTSAQRPIRQGQFQGYTPTAAASNVAPQIIPTQPNKTGMVMLDSVLAQNPELRKLYPDLFGG